MIHIRIPFAIDKDLGKACNREFENVPDGDWVLLLDHDVLLLTPRTIYQLYDYIHLYPGAEILTCYTQRTANKHQLYLPEALENDTLRYHIRIAHRLEQLSPTLTPIKEPISGFFMLVSKACWNKVKFPEGDKCLGVDTKFTRDVLAKGGRIFRMNTVYVWHTYRLMEGMNHKTHLL